ncbi:hypothetical protein HETIRDRAFT_471952 [Heterobasidion irregulare TC 32-1]|uniref:Urease accessory protein UreF n=1 Tax=Heterobasidion irregulare (strain TC 32-1) TaxID=747525 RepID=W4KEE1_HETIT|nr:uncharacterized protein HETIRDRAFT_471952 [Heterobasidion irregulare TC 32-1]ETW83690.1 hypothetical protein HETIRDRAFT_471952 [Heterobasidion irregulare TC 32-1]
MDAATESYLLLLLSDGNLPTGAFVASSGLESHTTHALGSARDPLGSTVAFVRDSVQTYARSALPFVRDAHRAVLAYASGVSGAGADADADGAAILDTLLRLDALYEANTLNHVARRASCAQGVALLTLYTKGFACPPFLASVQPEEKREKERRVARLVDRLKLLVRGEKTHGHLPVCWGVLVGALGLSLERGAHLHLFLHARGLLSAAIRMNSIGPYAAQQLLLHAVRPLVDAEAKRTEGLSTGVLREADEEEDVFAQGRLGPASTWPLGEIIAARHDQLHSRIFNS